MEQLYLISPAIPILAAVMDTILVLSLCFLFLGTSLALVLHSHLSSCPRYCILHNTKQTLGP